MNQRIMAGIGNIYADEILFQAKVHPQTNSGRLDDKMLESVFQQMKRILQTAIEKKANPSKMPHSWLFPRRKDGEECPLCGGDIGKLKVSGRTAYYCPSCQRKR
ncbi:MAG: zinc finger domain-containing protein [bacterium]